MRMNRFYFPIRNPNLSVMRLDDRELIHQMKDVFRMRAGDEFVVMDGKGNEYACMLEEFTKNYAQAKILGKKKSLPELSAELSLFCAVLKRENFELVVQKATELGARHIVPIRTARTVKLNLSLPRLKKIATEAAEQSGRGVIPSVSDIMDFADAVEIAKENETICFFDGSGSAPKKKIGEVKSVALFIGPEGGWSSEEMEEARESGFDFVKLGSFTLRAETAAILACGMFAYGQKDR